MDFELPEELRLLQQTMRHFVDRELIPVEMHSMDGPNLKPDIRADLEAKAKKLGLWNLDVPVEYGGQGLNLLGMTVVWRIGRRIAGPLAGLLALVLLACCPEYYGHMFMNPKDTPFAVAMAILLFGLVKTFERYPAPRFGATGLLGVGAVDRRAVAAACVAPDVRARAPGRGAWIGVDKPALGRMLGLSETQFVTFVQPVGYPSSG